MKELLDLADLLDEKGMEAEASLIDEAIRKTARKGVHKCGLKEDTVSSHQELLESYKRANDEHKKNYKKALLSSNSKDSPNEGELREALRGIAHNENAVHLHLMYFEDIIESKPCDIEKAPFIWEELNSRYVGSRNKLKNDIKRVAKTSRNGWLLINFCTVTGTISLDTIDLHEIGQIATRLPLTCIDLWEHAYFNDFGLDKEEYVDWVLSKIDWRKAEKRLRRYIKVK